MIDGGTFQVGLTVMNFIVSVSSGVACLPGFPVTTRVVQTWRAVLHHLQREVGDVEDDIGVAERAAPSWRGSQRQRSMLTSTVSICRSRFGLLMALTVRSSSTPVGLELGAFLEFAHGLGDLGVVMGVVGILGDAELGAQLRHARIFRRDPPAASWCRP